MYSNPRKLVIAVLVCLVLFVVGLTRMFQMRFAAGDVYPVYSSLRSDPLGTQVLYESIRVVRDGSTRRNFRPLDQKTWTGGDTFLVCGMPQSALYLDDKAWQDFLDQLAADGGRLVVTFRPDRQRSSECPDDCDGEAPDMADGTPSGSEEDDDPCGGRDAQAEEGKSENATFEPAWYGLLTELGLRVDETAEEAFDNMARRGQGAPEWLPGTVPWRSPLEFELDNDAWQVIYRRNGKPVVVERAWGKATVVFTADSYLLSNEALRSHRQPLLLSWLFPLGRDLVFDEYHNGLVKQPGIAGLMRKYRLYGVLASLAVLVFLLMWQQASVFVPRPAESDETALQAALGSETAEGWVLLMRQHIRPDNLLAVCYDAWRGSPAAGRLSEARLDAVARMMAEGAEFSKKMPVTWYRKISELIKQGKRA